MANDLSSLEQRAMARFRARRGEAQPSPALGTALLGAMDSDPDAVASQRELARRSGLPLPSVVQHPDFARRQASLQELDLEKLRRDFPATARTLENPDTAAVAHDAIDEMGFLERQVRDIGYGWRQGVRVKDLGLLGWDALMEQADEIDEARIAQIQAEMQADADLGVEPFLFRGVPYAEPAERFVLGIPGGVAEILPQMLQSTGAAIQGGLVGAAGGAATGAAAGFGAGGGPGAALGARFGAQAGFRTGSSLAVFMSAAKMEAGHAFVELRGITDETGQPIDPALAKTTALAVGAVNGALERLSFGVLTKHIPGLRSIMGREGAKRALQSAGVRRVLSGIAFSSAEGAATEGITEGVQEATAIIGEIVDGAITRGQSITEAIEAFSYAGRDPLTGEEIALTGADAIWARVVSSAVSGAQGGAGAAGAGRAMRVVADSQRAQAAIQRMPGLERMRELVGASRLLRRDKEAFREHVRTVAEDSGVRSVYIDAAALREWSTTADQKAVRQLFQDVEALQEQDEEVARTGADFQIPLEDFLAYVATNEAAADLMDAVRFDPMDMTAREALGFEEGLVRELGTFSELAGEARDGAQARDLLAGEVRAQLLKVHPDTVVDPMVELTVARYETRAQRLGIPLEELLQREGLFRVEPPNATEAERQGMLPPTLENRLDEAAVRRVVADLRKGQDLLPAGVSSTPMLDAIRALGGVDPEGDLGVGLRELEIPQAGRRGLVRKGGITNADQIVADETPLFVEAGLANAEGLVDHDRLIAAIQDEILGRPFRTADEGAVLADVQRERDAVLEALDAAGLSLESSDDEIVAAVARRQFREDKRGSITFDDELRNVVIRMTEASDLSTFLHESGHLYLAQLAKDAAEAGGQLEADLAVVREAFGDDVTSTEVQEAWARAFEAYLFEGSAPTLRLRAAFQRFSAWLVRIYKRLRGIPGFQGPLTPEIRGVMDRLIATDEEIEQTRTDLGLDEMDATALGLSEAEAARYRETVERARSEAASEMQAKLMAELARQKTEEWKELREKAHAEVEADVNQRPVFRAKHWLQRGEALEGAPVPILKHARLDRDALRQLYGPDILKVLPKGKYGLWQVNGLHPDTVAEVFGFESGDALVRALSAAGNRLDVIQAETDKLMESRHGKFQTQDEVAQLAIEALSNETQVKALLIEERALAKRAGGRVTPEQVARNAAKRIVGQTKYRDLAPHRYRQAAKRASRDAIEHAAEGRFAEAQASKRRQLVSMFMESEARKAIDQVDRAARYLHDVQKPKSRQRIGKAGGDHLNQMGQLLDRYDLRRGISLREIDRTKGLAAWIKEQEDAGAEVRVPQYLIDRTEKIAWKELTVDELLGLRDAVKNIEHLARMKNEFLANKRRRERDAVRADLVESIRKNATQRELPKELNLSKEEARARSLLSLDTQLVKIEFLADFLDGNDPNGHWKANVVEPIRDVARTRIEKSEQFTEALAGLYQRFLKPNLREYGKRVYLNELGVTGTKLEILMLALNMGAAENVQRIADGNGYSEAQVMALLDRTMTEADWQFVREVWALTGELGKWLFEVEARMTGLEPTKVEGRTIQTRFGEIEGAYFPIVYDPDGSRHSSRQALERANAGMELGIKALLGQPGAAKERVAKVVGRPIKLDLSVIPAHIDELINVLSARETVTQVWQLLDSDEIRNAFKGTTLGLSKYDLFRPWLEDVMRDRVVENRAIGDWSKVLRHVRLGSAVAKLALRETTLAGQLLGHSNAAGILATRLPNWQRHYASGFRRAFSNLRFWQVGNEIQEQSTFMRSRIASRDRDVQDIRRRAITDQLTATGKLKTQIDVMADFGMSLIGWVQFYGVDVPVWLAAYEGGIAEMDMSHDQAVRFADRSVAMSQGSGLRMDQSAVMRGDELMKSLTVFHGYMSTVFNQVDFDVVRSKRSPGARAAAFVSFMVVPTFGYAFVRELLTGRGGPPDDADDWLDYLSWSAGLMMSEMMNLAPIVREASSIPMAMLGGGRYFGGETPIQDQIDKLNDLVHPQDEVEFFADLARFMAPFLGGFPPENVVTKIENAASKD